MTVKLSFFDQFDESDEDMNPDDLWYASAISKTLEGSISTGRTANTISSGTVSKPANVKVYNTLYDTHGTVDKIPDKNFAVRVPRKDRNGCQTIRVSSVALTPIKYLKCNRPNCPKRFDDYEQFIFYIGSEHFALEI